MKKYAKLTLSTLLVVALLSICGSMTACKSSRTMYETKKYDSGKVIKDNYRVKGTNSRNGSTYRSY